jgi:cell division septum initiation protein DivIVA
MANEKTADLDYKAEYHKLIEEKEVLLAKMDFLRSELNSAETALATLRAQMDIVYLIFGGK